MASRQGVGHTRAAVGLLLALAAVPARAEGFDEALYAELLVRHTREVDDTAGTRVDYRALARSPEWPRLVEGLGRSDAQRLESRAQKLAFWINAYNVLAIDLVVRHYPVESIRDIGWLLRPVWKQEAGTVGGRPVTLHEIEHEILRPLGEPRIHAAIVCASISCPSLRREPWTARRLDAQLEDSLRRWLADPDKGLRLEEARGVVHLSRVFDWFAEDFDAEGGVLPFVARYADQKTRAWLEANGSRARLESLDYDWRLNDLALR